ncbi:MAG: hypothetical protein JNJ43_08150 [Anaerolineales bacterium]|nr:hypothetical protein [Anaerolineales bacterium]
MDIIQKVFKPVYGKPSWEVKQGYGSFLTLEFGEPRLHIYVPREATSEAHKSVKRRATRRQVYVHGKWHLWIYICNWKISILGKEVANHSSSRKVIQKATAELNGEALVNVTIDKSFITTFEFDLGRKLISIPNHKKYDLDSELWLLYEPSGKVFTLRADGQYSHTSANGKTEDNWKQLSIR